MQGKSRRSWWLEEVAGHERGAWAMIVVQLVAAAGMFVGFGS